MKKLPQRIWVDQDSCWNEKPQNSEGYVEYVREDYHAQALLHVLNKGVRQGKKEMLEKACKWLSLNLQMLLNVFDVEYNTNDTKTEYFINDFRKAMEE